MSGTSLAGLLILCAVIVAGLAIWLTAVFWAGRHPFYRGRRQAPPPGDVRGGAFLGDGGAVTPRRDAEPDPDREWPEPIGDHPARDESRADGGPGGQR